MKKIFIDTNIIIDLLADRRPYSKFAIALFAKAESKKIKLYTSSHTFATTYYLFKKHVEDKNLRLILLGLLEYINIIPIDTHIIKRGLKSKHKDFEDALQILSAMSIDKMDCIVTRNLKDFKDSEIPVFSPEGILNEI
ncbi:MAG TPA: PIN domain-containing protein [Chitinophagaceae bacterium]|mgnify:CR=1 FL=1|nr:MAG: twitching motility protein PilT [Bacteroidetes bacterium OLB11]HMN32183.1 PIN domain-containing protein [Chitinophagaceae bacterium]